MAAADQVVIGPGSLFTSVLAAAAIPGIAKAIARCGAQRVYVCNLRPQEPESAGYDVASHVRALADHGVSVDVVLYDPSSGMAVGDLDAVGAFGGSIRVVETTLSSPSKLAHDPAKLAGALSGLLA